MLPNSRGKLLALPTNLGHGFGQVTNYQAYFAWTSKRKKNSITLAPSYTSSGDDIIITTFDA